MGLDWTQKGDAFSFDCKNGVVIEIDRLCDDSGGLTGEITIVDEGGLSTRLLHCARLNLMSTQSRSTLVRSLEKAKEGVQWHQILEEVCFVTKDTYRKGTPLIRIGNLPPSPLPRWMVYPYVEYGGPTILFGDGSAGKSILAAAIAVGVAGGYNIIGKTKCPPTPVAYLDWEASKEAHDTRIKAICKTMDLQVPDNIFYRREHAHIAQSADDLRRQLQKEQIGFIIIDSLAAACGGEPESAEVITRLFNAARSFGVPWLGIHHVTKSAASNGDAKKPFGSVFAHNLARLTWGVEAEQQEGDDFKGVTLTNHKNNNGRLEKKQTYRIQYYNEGDPEEERLVGVEIKRCDVSEFPELLKRRSTTERIIIALRQSPKTYVQLQTETGASHDVLMARMADLRKAGVAVKIPGSTPVAFALVDRQHANG